MSGSQVIAGKYKVLRRLGAGGMSTVYLAENIRLGAQVALKVLKPEGAADPAIQARFEREARIACQLKSPYCVRVYDVERGPAGELVIVMEHLEGRDLQSVLDDGDGYSRAQAIEWVSQACAAMDEAHALGIVHRDLKPANLFLAAPGRTVKVLDFGLSRQQGQNRITTAEELLGTPSYMSPEQASGAEVTAKSDVWSLCVVLYRLLAGRLPWQPQGAKEDVWALANRIANAVPEPLPKAAQVPPALAAVVMRGLERVPSKRLASVKELSAALAPHWGTRPSLADAGDEPTLPATKVDAARRSEGKTRVGETTARLDGKTKKDE